MFKKLMLGMIMCCGAAGAMNSVEKAVIESPTDSVAVKNLVESVYNNNNKTLTSRNHIYSEIKTNDIDELDSSQLGLLRVCAMLYQLSRDIRSCGVYSQDYYISGALKGEFGPY